MARIWDLGENLSQRFVAGVGLFIGKIVMVMHPRRFPLPAATAMKRPPVKGTVPCRDESSNPGEQVIESHRPAFDPEAWNSTGPLLQEQETAQSAKNWNVSTSCTVQWVKSEDDLGCNTPAGFKAGARKI